MIYTEETLKRLSRKNNIMLDIEGLGDDPGAVVPSVGLVQFNPMTGDIFEKLKVNINIQSALNVGLTISGRTLKWWFEQDKEAINAMLENPLPIKEALNEIRKFAQKVDPTFESMWWANGGDYDFVFLGANFNAVKVSLPWKHKNKIDMRSMRNWTGYKAPDEYYDDNNEFGVHHDAVGDCIRQVRMVKDMMEIGYHGGH